MLEPVEVMPVEYYTEARIQEFLDEADMSEAELQEARSAQSVGSIKVFLGTHMLFSAALGGGSSFDLLWEIAQKGKIDLFTSRYCRLEAERNLEQKPPSTLERYTALMDTVQEPPPMRHTTLPPLVLPDKDIPVYTAAIAAGAHVLLTSDRRHFGQLMRRHDLPLRARSVRSFLLEGLEGAA